MGTACQTCTVALSLGDCRPGLWLHTDPTGVSSCPWPLPRMPGPPGWLHPLTCILPP